jgi:hypothetical protein
MAAITPDRSDPIGDSFGGTTAGETPTPYTPAGAGDTVALVGSKVTLLFVTATSNTPTVTLDSVTPSDQGNDNNLTLTLPATGIRRITLDASSPRFKQLAGAVGSVALSYSPSPTGTTLYAWYTN